MLEGAVDSQFGIGDPEWNIYLEFRGYDAGTNLKSTSGWYENGNGADLFGFSGLPGGDRHPYGVFYGSIGYCGLWWSSTEINDNNAWHRYLYNVNPGVLRIIYPKDYGFSVRCLRDE